MGKAAKFLYLLSGRLGGLLGEYGGAAAAYSLRNLSTSTTNVVKVRRDSDDSEQDFTASDIIDGTLLSFVNADVEKIVNGDFATDTDWTKGTGWSISGGTANCDGTQTSNSEFKTTVGIAVQGVQVTFSFEVKNYSAGTLNATLEGTGTLDFSGINANGVYSTTATSSDPLPRVVFTASSDFIGSIDDVSVIQSTVNGFVTTWYDQSGNTNNATQATAANQPKIVDSGSLITNNGKATIEGDGTNGKHLTTSDITLSGDLAMIAVCSFEAHPSDSMVLGGTHPATQSYVRRQSATNLEIRNNSGTGFGNFTVSFSSQDLFFVRRTGTTIGVSVNGTETTYTEGATQGVDFTVNRIGGGFTDQYSLDGNYQEIILYNSDQSAKRTGIEGNINAHYNIYP